MKKLIVILVPVIVVVAAAFLFFIFYASSGSNASTSAPASRLMSIESYVSQNISELSPQKASLGGTFQVTDISVNEGKGTVSYEDGHNAYTADFTYEAADRTGIHITSFVIRK